MRNSHGTLHGHIYRVIFLNHTEVIAQDYTTQSHKTVPNLLKKQHFCVTYRRQEQSLSYLLFTKMPLHSLFSLPDITQTTSELCSRERLN